ncbi:hypothetical protein GQ44DRAFT_696630 [Phaeosphaeriaceae sp. PMI808]|nr:hypothetical protein GQ44DRAFT_696630 [Phaeosphaeriaceae sp. PMI808]
MFLLRRAAARAINATSSKAILARPRSITTFSPSAFRPQQQKWSIAFQRRFASDETTKTEENFAQTAAEAPMEDGLTPAPQAEQSEPIEAGSTNAEATVGVDALDAASQAKPKSRRRDDDVPPSKTVYVGNLYYEVTADQLKKVFSRFGEVSGVKLVYDNRGLSRGFGYVDFQNISDAQSAIDNLDMQLFEGRNLVVQYHRAKPRSGSGIGNGNFAHEPSAPSNTLFIGNMSFEMSDKDLNDLFRDIRNVMDVRVAIDRRTGQPRGFAHADFVDVASATKAKQILQSKTIYGRELRVDFSKSTTMVRRDRREDSGSFESEPKE